MGIFGEHVPVIFRLLCGQSWPNLQKLSSFVKNHSIQANNKAVSYENNLLHIFKFITSHSQSSHLNIIFQLFPLSLKLINIK